MPIAKAMATYLGGGADYSHEGQTFVRDVPMLVMGEALISKLESIGNFRVVRRPVATLVPEASLKPTTLREITAAGESGVEAPVAGVSTAPPASPEGQAAFEKVASQNSASLAAATAAGGAFAGRGGPPRKKG